MVIFLTTVVFFSTSCSKGYNHVKEIDKAALVGTWVPEDVSDFKSMLQQKGYVVDVSIKHYIRLNDDGFCDYHTFPHFRRARAFTRKGEKVISEDIIGRIQIESHETKNLLKENLKYN